MNYRSIADLARCVRGNAHSIPKDIDLVVGIPRSGMLAADIVALTLNLGVTDLHSWLRNDPVESGRTRTPRRPLPRRGQEARNVLLVDDSICFGRAMQETHELIRKSGFPGKVTTCAIYAAPAAVELVDLALEIVPLPRAFEWNVLHRNKLSKYCMDIDGVLCVDPSSLENDDGPAYRRFLEAATPLIVPSHPIGHLVTSRIEKYRERTEAWLSAQGIEFGTLHMLDCVDAETRRRQGMHAAFKAEVYRRQHDTSLFIESDPRQANEIARLSGKPVLCYSTQEFFEPGLSSANLEVRARTLRGKLERGARRLFRSLIGQ